MTSLTSLIERVEAATEGSRELDILIGTAVDLRVDECDLSFRQSFEICGMEQMLRSAESHQNIWREALPRYSTSIDAALTLLPEGWIINFLSDEAEGFIGTLKVTGCACEITDGNSNQPGNAATRCLALLAAILRARQTAQSGQAQTEARG